MHQEGVDLQTAVDFVGNMCKQSIDRFNEDRARLPSWGPEIDRDVSIYVDGLANWIVGSLHWSFESERYFGKSGRQVKATRTVDLLPLRAWMKRMSKNYQVWPFFFLWYEIAEKYLSGFIIIIFIFFLNMRNIHAPPKLPMNNYAFFNPLFYLFIYFVFLPI